MKTKPLRIAWLVSRTLAIALVVLQCGRLAAQRHSLGFGYNMEVSTRSTPNAVIPGNSSFFPDTLKTALGSSWHISIFPSYEISGKYGYYFPFRANFKYIMQDFRVRDTEDTSSATYYFIEPTAGIKKYFFNVPESGKGSLMLSLSAGPSIYTGRQISAYYDHSNNSIQEAVEKLAPPGLRFLLRVEAGYSFWRIMEGFVVYSHYFGNGTNIALAGSAGWGIRLSLVQRKRKPE